MRAWCNGCTRPFQGLSAGSSPVARSTSLLAARRQPRPQGAAPPGGSPAVAISAYDLALLYLVEDALPAAVGQGLPDVEALVTKVIELEHHRVGLAAVDARMLLEEPEEVARPLKRKRLLALSRLIDVTLPVRRVVTLVIRGSAGSAQAVALASVDAPPGEVLQRLLLTAVPAPFGS
jgi:hypothetical protein